MNPTLEKAARAICVANGEDPDAADTPYEIRGWRLYKTDAAAAISSALLDPSDDVMQEALRAARTTAHWFSGTDDERLEAIVKSVLRAAAMKITGQ